MAVVERADPTRLLGAVTTETISALLRPARAAGAEPEGLEGGVARRDAATVAGVGAVGVSGDALERLTVADTLFTGATLVGEDEPLMKAQELLAQKSDALLVVNGQGALVGIVTRADLAARRAMEDGKALTVGDVATRNLVTLRMGESLRVAARRISRLGLRQAPVVGDEGKRPLGLLRRRDVLAAYERVAGTLDGPEDGEDVEEDQSVGPMTERVGAPGA